MIVQIVKRRQYTKRAGSRRLARKEIITGDVDSKVVHVVLAEENSTRRRARVRVTVHCEVGENIKLLEFGIFPEGSGVQVAEFASSARAESWWLARNSIISDGDEIDSIIVIETEEIRDRRRETRDEVRRLARNTIIRDGDDVDAIVGAETEEI